MPAPAAQLRHQRDMYRYQIHTLTHPIICRRCHVLPFEAAEVVCIDDSVWGMEA